VSVPELKTEDYLFMRYKALVVQLEDVCKDYISELAVCINQRHETAKKDYATFHR